MHLFKKLWNLLKSTAKSKVFELYKKIGIRNTRREKETFGEKFSKEAVILRDDKEEFIYSWERQQIDACGQCSYGTLQTIGRNAAYTTPGLSP